MTDVRCGGLLTHSHQRRPELLYHAWGHNLKELYAGHGSGILMLDSVLGRQGQDIEIEDIVGEAHVLEALKTVLSDGLMIDETDRSAGSLLSRTKVAAERRSLSLPGGWKASVARHMVTSWAEDRTTLAENILEEAASLFVTIKGRFEAADETASTESV